MAEYRRNLPHYQPDNTYLFLTWRLHGSLPVHTNRASYRSPGHAFVAQDRILHRHEGPVWLQDPRIANIMAEAIRQGDQTRLYELYAWVIMPNHVHMLVLPVVPTSVFMKSLKGTTARKSNAILNRTGQPFWQDESFDHYVRNERQFNQITEYTEMNPVHANLVSRPELWPWSSASSTAQAKACATQQ